MINQNYIVATLHSWNVDQFNTVLKKHSGNWHLITNPNELRIENIREINPRYIFFPHWSSTVDIQIINNFECVCFHSTDLPYGRGGSPIQNLIMLEHENTMITALKMTEKLDAGPIYFKSELSLTGRAQEIFERASKIISKMIMEIILKNPFPKDQVGEIVNFKRKKDNVLPQSGSIKNIYNHIRMLDAENYPKTFVKHGEFILTFSNAEVQDQDVYAIVKITRDITK